MAAYVDLHIHTCYSDGVATPAEVIERVRQKGLAAFSITDHDNLGGFLKARDLMADDSIELIAGVELSVGCNGPDPHILGYGFDPEDKSLNRALDEFRVNRNQRGQTMVEKLNDLGLTISYDDVLECASGGAVGRPHVARVMEKVGAVSSYEEAFLIYLANGKPAYVPKQNLPAAEAIALLHNAGGIAVLAHPMVEETYKMLDELVTLGLDGVEAFHPSHRQSDCDRFRELARKKDLIITGGSDYHGIADRHSAIGSQKVPVELLTVVNERCQQIRNRI